MWKAVFIADSGLSYLPQYRALKGMVLDRVLGPAEDLTYVSKTTPKDLPQDHHGQ